MRILLAGLLACWCSVSWAQDPYDDPQYQDQQYQPPPQQQYAPQYGYVGAHPIPYENGSGYCYQGAAHFHEYAPFDQYLFREQGGYFYFVGDPGDFGYAQQLWGYQGHHPIPGHYGGGYCYIDWGHNHPFAPAAGVSFNFIGGYYVYHGAWDPSYYRWRSHHGGYWGGYYRSTYYGNRYYSTRPRHVYRPSLTIGAPGVYRSRGVTVVAPGVRVGPPARTYAPAPRVYAPAPRVYAPAPTRVYAPPPAAPAPRVYAPAPTRVYAPPPPAPAPTRVYAPAPAAPGPVVGPPNNNRRRRF